MAKMFYSIEEAAQRMGKSVDQVKKMASSGQLQEFRDRDRLMFKREQVDLLAGDVGAIDAGAELPLADSKAGSKMGGSSLTLALEDEPGECTFECWIQLDGATAKVRSRMVNHRSDTTQYAARQQELPASALP